MKRLIESCLSDSAGNAVLGALVNITYSTLLTLSVLSLSMSAYNTLLIRDAAIEAAARAALPEAPSQLPYLRRLLDDRLPMLASFDVQPLEQSGLVGFRVVSFNPVLGLLQTTANKTEVLVAKEELPLR
jgi:hypothetical protein